LAAPFRFQIARGEDGHEHGRLGELAEDLIGEDVIALQLLVPPDVRILARITAEHLSKRLVEDGHPPLLLIRERFVVDMGVADESVSREAHGSRRFPTGMDVSQYTAGERGAPPTR